MRQGRLRGPLEGTGLDEGLERLEDPGPIADGRGGLTNMAVAGSDAVAGTAVREDSRKHYDAFISYAHEADTVLGPGLAAGPAAFGEALEPPPRHGGIPGREQPGGQPWAVAQHLCRA